MDLNARRKMIRTDEGGGYEVSSDGSTVWVNEVFLVARFCPFSREYVAVGADAPHALQPLVQRLPQPQGGWGGLSGCWQGASRYTDGERGTNSDGGSSIREKGL